MTNKKPMIGWSSFSVALLTSGALLSLSCAQANTKVDPEADRQAMVKYMMDMHGSTARLDGKPVTIEDFGMGAYIFSDDAYKQWKSAEEFPPYIESIELGEKLWKQPFANGKTYSSCAPFSGNVKQIRANYPLFDDKRAEVINLDQAINECRTANGEKEYAWAGRDRRLNNILAYLANESRGQKINVKIDTPGAIEAYKLGEMVFHTRRGQLNQACASCHINSASRKIRSEILSPIVGHATHFPVYRGSRGYLVSLQERYEDCMESVRAFPFESNSAELKALEFYESFMSNGLKIDGPAYRK